MVSTAIGLFTLAVAVRVVSDHTVILGQTNSRMDMHQSARMAIELIAEDLRHAGLGIGYRPDGSFGGLLRGTYTVAGGAQFSADNFVQTLSTGPVTTDDLGIRMATGEIRTVASFSGGSGQICAASDLAANDVVVLLSREALHVRTVRLQSLSSAACVNGFCLGGCQTFTFQPDTTYESDALAVTANYVDGTMIGDYAEIVWFVAPGADAGGELRRAEVTQTQPCAARDTTCGGLVAEDVETLQTAVWQWDDQLGQWVDQTPSAAIQDRRRVRVDVELVLRGYRDDQRGAHQPVPLSLDTGQCVGGPCGGAADQFRRVVIRTSIEVRNGGRMLIR